MKIEEYYDGLAFYTEDGEYRETDLAVISAKEALARVPIMFNRDKYK